MKVIMAFDVAIGCTGWAVLSVPRGDAIIDAGTITTKRDASTFDRCAQLCEEAQEVINPHAIDVCAVGIEMPLESTRGMSRKRSNSSLPTYGFALGAFSFGVRFPPGARMFRPSASEWAANLPSTNRDKHKVGRVNVCAGLYGRTPESFGVKSKAGNVADAILLARWVAGRI